MPAPQVSFTYDTGKVSAGQIITLTFSADAASTAAEVRVTRSGAGYGVGVGTLIASFSSTPADTERTVEIYDDYLVNGDGDYRISLFAQGEDGSWNDDAQFYTSSGGAVLTSDGKNFLVQRS